MGSIDSHLPVLKKVLETIPAPGNILEFGCGDYSTPTILSAGHNLISVEQQDTDWLSYVAKTYGNHRWIGVLAIGPLAYRRLTWSGPYDLIIVDGHGESRPEVINSIIMGHLATKIIIHDTQQPTYGWGRVKKEDGWLNQTYKPEDGSPWTTTMWYSP